MYVREHAATEHVGTVWLYWLPDLSRETTRRGCEQRYVVGNSKRFKSCRLPSLSISRDSSYSILNRGTKY